MTLEPISPAPIAIGAAVQDGWRAFRRAPWTFVGFTLVAGLLGLLGEKIQLLASVGPDANAPALVMALLVNLLGLGLGLVVSLWMNVGLLRGVWMALDGSRPRFADLARWDGPAMVRLLLVGLLLLLINLLILVISGLASGLLSQVHQLIGLLPALAGGLVFLYIAVTQVLHLPLAVVGGLGAVATFQSGRMAFTPRWGSTLAFALVLALVLLAGVLALMVGLLVAMPVAMGTLAAAYRQVFGHEDPTGLVRAAA